MTLSIYALVIFIGTVMIVTAHMQRKRDGQYNRRSKVLLNIGVFVVVFSLAEKLPHFIRVICNSLWQQ